MRAPSVTIGGSGTVAGEEAALIQQMENHLSTLNPSDQDEDEDYNGRRVLHPRVLYVYNGTVVQTENVLLVRWDQCLRSQI